MGTTYYYTVNDEIIAEHTLGQSRLDYLTDGIGSVIATIDQTLTVQSTARYKPFGAVLASTGTLPRFGYCGNTGSRRTNLPHAEQYNWFRHFGAPEGRWTTVDPLWPNELAYRYTRQNPTTLIDPSGLQVIQSDIFPGPLPIQCGEPWTSIIFSYCNNCYYGSAPRWNCVSVCSNWGNQYYYKCGKDSKYHSSHPSSFFRPAWRGGPVVPDRFSARPVAPPVMHSIGPGQCSNPTDCIKPNYKDGDFEDNAFDLQGCRKCCNGQTNDTYNACLAACNWFASIYAMWYLNDRLGDWARRERAEGLPE